ncbi:MAG TPA: PfkB family carbohydrate kinase [Methylomirabilota bacterium]|nr:PfkB family carbohydrate kinase [Methylomirabilota bacterium]
MPPQFLVIGHAVQDLTPGESAGDGAPWRLGGTVSYAALLASRLGLRTAVFTAAAPDLPLEEALPGVEVVRIPSERSTQIRNVYQDHSRVQYIVQQAAPIGAEALPDEFREAEIVLLGPVTGKVDIRLGERFPRALIGVSAQGWLRELDADGRVRPVRPERWQADSLLQPGRVLFVSDEDLPPDNVRAVLDRWSGRVEVLAFTRAERGAEVCHRGVWKHIDAFPAATVDPTGAGDVFAAAFLVRYRESGDPWEATRFAACAASFIVESEGLANTPDRRMIDERLRAHPEIVPR